MQPAYFDNRTSILKDDLVRTIRTGDVVSVASSVFSMYAYRELRQQLEGVDEFRFIFTEPTFLKERRQKEQREFYIPRLNREQGLFGTELEIRLRNELTQKAVATECARWIERKATFKTFHDQTGLPPSLTVASESDAASYQPLSRFTTAELGVGGASVETYAMMFRQDTASSRQLLSMFDAAWNSPELDDVTDAVIDNIQAMYRENPPELVYYVALYRIFHEFLDDVTSDELPKEGTGFRESRVWNLLYDFQRDAVLAIINKLQSFNGCILADSVGLGKTFTALAVIKYYELLNRKVLVLCPKRLSDNWLLYKQNYANNPLADDRLNYDVLYHTDLSRSRGRTVEGIDLERLNWGNYDLVVIDESHNFRNGADTSSKAADQAEGNRFERLLNRMLKGGVPTKVLMLSATPVNNRFRDLHNQLRLVYQGDADAWGKRFGLTQGIDNVFRDAQHSFKMWSKLPAEERTTKALMDSLSFDFFTILDSATVARSRSHICRYYDASKIGPFPERLAPVSLRPKLSTDSATGTFREIAETLGSLTLAVYLPTSYLHKSRLAKYADEQGKPPTSGREQGMVRLMSSILLKRLESSVASFRITLEKIIEVIEGNLRVVERYAESPNQGTFIDAGGLDAGAYEEDECGFSVGTKNRFDLADMDWMTWGEHMRRDLEALRGIRALIAPIDADHDAKLLQLWDVIRDKAEHPINPGNRKVLVFTAFADTADYLYEQLGDRCSELGLGIAEVTGGASGGRTAVPGVRNDMGEILTCFSPVSKDRDIAYPRLVGKDIDILIATDCISEGQNLQDCDCVVNFDIHWNPVRVVQRFGRVDRIGSKNACIQLVNFWPDVELDEYINLKARVENKMHALVMASTGDDDYLNEGEEGDLEYRRVQLEQMQHQVVDLEDVSGGVSITDLGLNDFRMDLVAYHDANPDIEHVPAGIDAVVEGEDPGIIFVLRNVNQELERTVANPVHPFYLVYVKDAGEVLHGYLDPKDTLDVMRRLCRGKSEPDVELCRSYNRATKNGRDMRHASELLEAAVLSIVDEKREADVDSFFSAGITSFLEKDVAGLDDFELVCFLVVRPHE